VIGIKVWIYKGLYAETEAAAAAGSAAQQGPRRPRGGKDELPVSSFWFLETRNWNGLELETGN